jgi:hypothetical protein
MDAFETTVLGWNLSAKPAHNHAKKASVAVNNWCIFHDAAYLINEININKVLGLHNKSILHC